jgi:hypothetical protein
MVANADAWIDQNSATSNKGTDSILHVRTKSSRNNFRTLLRFALPPVPQGCVVDTAKLRMFAPSATTGRTLHAQRLTAAWQEYTVNWNTQPAATGSNASASSGQGWREWNVLEHVKAMYSANTAHGFVIRDASESGNGQEQQFHSREKGETPPELVVTFKAIQSSDTAAPDSTVQTAPNPTTTSTSATFTFTSTETGSVFECSLDNGGFAPCVGPVEYTELEYGTHSFAVRATDQAGNTDTTPATRSWTIQDPSAPTSALDTTLGTTPPQVTSSTSAAFSFTASIADATFQCSLDDAQFTTCASPLSFTNLAVGSHQLEVRAVNGAELDTTPAAFIWTIEPQVNCGNPLTVVANADAWIDENSALTNKGTDSILKVMTKEGTNNFRTLVRFALPPKPQGCTVQTATLQMYAPGGNGGRTLQALRIGAAWQELDVTWNNQPPTTGTAATTSSGTGMREWSVGAQVLSMYDLGAAHGFLIRDAVEGGPGVEQQYHSREKGETPPTLIITFGPQ